MHLSVRTRVAMQHIAIYARKLKACFLVRGVVLYAVMIAASLLSATIGMVHVSPVWRFLRMIHTHHSYRNLSYRGFTTTRKRCALRTKTCAKRLKIYAKKMKIYAKKMKICGLQRGETNKHDRIASAMPH